MKRLFLIGIFALLITSMVIIWSKSFYESQKEADISVPIETEKILIPSEIGVFKRSKFANEYTKMNANYKGGRSLDSYYKNRAFHGAPPSIPHTVQNERNMGAKSCLKCHENGGYVAEFKTFAPVVPHPELVNCRQCHVAQITKGQFKAFNDIEKYKLKVGNAAFTNAPPIIPHQIQLHENCLSCHAGPSAPVEIRVTHPERSNCRQCHVINNKEMTDIGDFTR